MALIKPRTRGKQLVRHRTRLDHETNESQYVWAAAMAAVVLIECLVLAANRGACPLTGVAARYTEERAANFDIYLPLWLARRNKPIFGTLFVAGGVFALARWLTR